MARDKQDAKKIGNEIADELETANQKEARFKERLKEIYFQAKDKSRQEYAGVEAEKAAIKKQEDSLGSDGKPLWDKVNEGGYRLIHDNAAGWQEFPNFMMSLVHHAMDNAIANWYDPIEITYFLPYRDEIGGALVKLKDSAISGTMNFFERHLLLDDKQLANVSFRSNINEKGQLNVEVLVNGQPDPDPQLKTFIEEGVIRWAKVQDYKYDPATKTFTDENNVTMTDEKFRELNADPENSVLKSLSSSFDYALKEEPTSSPIPGF